MSSYYTKNLIPCCYFPGTVILVDDNLKFLDSLKFNLSRQLFKFETFSDPVHAFQRLEAYESSKTIQNCLSYYPNLELDDFAQHTAIYLEKLHYEMFNPNRINEIVLVLVDQMMPEMDGLMLCERVRKKPFQLVLLTGTGIEDVAVKAFNRNLIDRFLQKADIEKEEDLIAMIYELHRAYFISRSQPILHNLLLKYNVIQDPVFIDWFYQLVRDKNILEYYMLNGEGNFVLLDSEKQLHWLITNKEADYEHWLCIARDMGVSQKYLSQLENREVLFYIPSYEKWPHNEAEWKQYLYPAQVLNTEKPIYYALIEQSYTEYAEKLGIKIE